MLEQIASLVKQFGQDSVVNNPDVPNDENNAVLAEATKTISGGMQNMMAGGGLQDIISMFTGGGGNNQSGSQSGGIASIAKNPMVTMMIGHFVNKLISKFSMSPQKANNVASSLIPNVVSDLVTRTKDNSPDNSSFNLNDLIGSLSGGGQTANAGNGSSGGFDFQSLISQFTGGGEKKETTAGNGGGGFDLQDIISKVTKGAQEKQEEQSGGGGGLLDMIKGFISK